MIPGGTIDMSDFDYADPFAKPQMACAQIRGVVWLSLIILLSLGVTAVVPQISFAADVKVTASNSELAKAEKVAKAAFKEAAGRKVKNFSWRLIVEDQTEWVFSFEDLDAPSVPGSDYFITVKKEDFKASVRHGY
jgi:hypothetical protein